MSTKSELGIKSLTSRIVGFGHKLRPYRLPAFLVFIALIYGFLFLRINTLSNAEPSSSAVSSQLKTARLPHIDPKVVKQLQSLRDNSVNVQSLFSQSRNNPFQE
ncbi:MAG TPA: hypothetical protein VLF79_01955 [Candidatus Saccharimonadales bacterium]|nr:hypothetical protein [Candidatus Saccharimonadales bacterium]